MRESASKSTVRDPSMLTSLFKKDIRQADGYPCTLQALHPTPHPKP